MRIPFVRHGLFVCGASSQSRGTRAYRRLQIEVLEHRDLLAVALSTSVSPPAMSPSAATPIRASAAEPDNPNDLPSRGVRQQTEMMIAVDPTNPLHLAGFSHRLISQPEYNPMTLCRKDDILPDIDIYESTNGGTTWSLVVISDGTISGVTTIKEPFVTDTTFARRFAIGPILTP